MEFETLPDAAHPLVALRPLRPSDIPVWYGYLSRPEVFEHTSWNLQGESQLAHYVQAPEHRTPSSMLRLAVARRVDDRLVGTIGFHTVSPENRSAELAYDLAPDVWGQGLATHLCKTIVGWAHDHVGLHRVQATVLDTNQRSLRVLQRCGFEREGLLRSYRLVRGRPGDFWMHAHLRPTQSS